jgi:translocation and assembly module TamB
VKSTDQIGGNLDVRVDRISQPGVNISLVQLNAKGNEKQHDLQLRCRAIRFPAAVAGGQLRSQSGALERHAEQYPLPDAGGAGGADAHIALDYRNREQKISIGPHCWTNPNAELCVPQTIDAGASGRAW